MRPPQFSFTFEEPHLRFIVHEHQATRHHYDLRLEFGQVLLDLVIPKGPSTDPRIARRVIRCPDHAKSCLRFEGRIRQGAYGAGPLLAWDEGVYKPICRPGISHEEAILEGLRRGRLKLLFYGSKLKGAWTLKRFGDIWLFVKDQDRFASQHDIRLQNRSVRSGRTLSEL